MRRRTPTTIGPAPVGSSDLCCTLPAPSLLVAGPVTGLQLAVVASARCTLIGETNHQRNLVLYAPKQCVPHPRR